MDTDMKMGVNEEAMDGQRPSQSMRESKTSGRLALTIVSF
jgi:hypothetical protein